MGIAVRLHIELVRICNFFMWWLICMNSYVLVKFAAYASDVRLGVRLKYGFFLVIHIV